MTRFIIHSIRATCLVKMSRRAEGQLFIGRLSKSTRVRDLEDVFEPYGRMTRCEVKYGNNERFFLFFEVFSSPSFNEIQNGDWHSICLEVF